MIGGYAAFPRYGKPLEHPVAVHLANSSSRDISDLEATIVSIPPVVLVAEDQETGWDVSIVLTSDQHLSELHAEFLDDPSVTDVMSFNYGLDPSTLETIGEIIVSVDRAEAQAKENQWSLKEEISFLVIHGMLHLCGWTDDDKESQEAMFARQRELMQLID